MRVLLADDSSFFRAKVQAAFAEWGLDVVTARDGQEAWDILQRDDPPEVAVLDWIMPGLDGIEVCQHVRASRNAQAVFLILLTVKDTTDDVVAGLEGGADEYVAKPVDLKELKARIRVGFRIASLQRSLASRVRELEDALSRVKQLQGLLPICAWCKRIRNDDNYWQQVEGYITQHTEARFSHAICPECMAEMMRPGEPT